MLFRDFKHTNEYKTAIILEVFDANGIEFDDHYPEEKLEEMNVMKCELCGNWVSVTLG